jgi:hypothetical protein
LFSGLHCVSFLVKPPSSVRWHRCTLAGPLKAVIDAQVSASLATVQFIKNVGFDSDNKVITTDFKYTTVDVNGTTQARTLTVPFLSLLPVPNMEACSQYDSTSFSRTRGICASHSSPMYAPRNPRNTLP